jgi:hypothetical protein
MDLRISQFNSMGIFFQNENELPFYFSPEPFELCEAIRVWLFKSRADLSAATRKTSVFAKANDVERRAGFF